MLTAVFASRAWPAWPPIQLHDGIQTYNRISWKPPVAGGGGNEGSSAGARGDGSMGSLVTYIDGAVDIGDGVGGNGGDARAGQHDAGEVEGVGGGDLDTLPGGMLLADRTEDIDGVRV